MSWSAYLKNPFQAAVDVTNFVTIKRVCRLSRPWSVDLSAQAEEISFQVGYTQVLLYENATLKFNGRIQSFAYNGTETDATVTLTAWDPMIYWDRRPVRDSDGDFSKPDILEDFLYAPAIILAALNNSVDIDGQIGLEAGFEEVGSVVPCAGNPGDWPMTLEELRRLLVGTGKLDLVIRPVDGLAGGATYETTMGYLDAYKGSYGDDLSGSVELAWGASPYNIELIDWTGDMATVCNKLWYFLGPKCTEQRWRGNITRDDPTLPGNSQSNYPGVGGELYTPLYDRQSVTSRNTYFPLMEIKVFDDLGGDCWDDPDNPVELADTGNNAYRSMYQLLWQNESWLRAVPRQLVSWQPVADYALQFDVGDLITVTAGARLGGGFTGVQRVYEYTQEIDVNGTVTTTNIVTSADQET